MATGGTGVTITIDGMNNQDGCRDIDECNTLKPCGANSLCTNSPGSFKCDCRPGFEGDAIDGCTDINECQDNSPCRGAVNGDFGYRCENTFGSYICHCKERCLDDMSLGSDPIYSSFHGLHNATIRMDFGYLVQIAMI